MYSYEKGLKSVFFYIYMVAAAGVILFYTVPHMLLGHSFLSYNFAFISSLWIILTLILEKAAPKFIASKYSAIAVKVITGVRLGIAIFIFLILTSENSNYKLASVGVLFLTILRVGFIFLELYKRYFLLTASLKSFLYILSGLSMLFISWVLWESEPNSGVDISISFISMMSFMFLSICSLLSLLQLTGNPKLHAAGRWCEKAHGIKYACAFFFFLIVKDFRAVLHNNNQDGFSVAEWVLIAVALIIVSLVIMLRIKKIFNSYMNSEFTKYKNKLNMGKSRELTTLGMYMDEFIETGYKNNFITSVIFLAKESGLSVDAANRFFLEPVLNHKDADMPPTVYNAEKLLIDRKNKEFRREVVCEITSRINFRGSNNEY